MTEEDMTMSFLCLFSLMDSTVVPSGQESGGRHKTFFPAFVLNYATDAIIFATYTTSMLIASQNS